MGDRRQVRISGQSVGISYNLDDYPPRTPLPDGPEPDLSALNSVWRGLMGRRLRKARIARMARLEAIQDEYFRRVTDGEDGATDL